MARLVLCGLLLTGTLVISKTYGEIDTTEGTDTPAFGNQYSIAPPNFTNSPINKWLSSKGLDFQQNKFFPLSNLKQTLNTINNLQRNILNPFYSFPINPYNVRRFLNNPAQSPLYQYGSNLWSNNLINGQQNDKYFPQMNNDFFKRTYINPYTDIQKIIQNQHGGNGGYSKIMYNISVCCINGNCRTLKDGEVCDFDTGDTAVNKNSGQQPSAVSSNEPLNSDNNRLEIYAFGKENFNGNTNSDGNGDYNTMHSPSDELSENNQFGNDITNARNQVLERSNYYRNKHNIDPLTLDENLNNYAQEWANHLAKAGNLHHRHNHVYGENLYSKSNSKSLGESAVDAWYHEILYYNANANDDQLYANNKIHHMTQLLWKSSKKLGVGISKDNNGMYIVVANYDPAGNVKRQFQKNLPKITQNDINKLQNALKK